MVHKVRAISDLSRPTRTANPYLELRRKRISFVCQICKILAPVGSKTVYSSCAAQKAQITTLVAISASGQIIPKMHISPGQRFAYNPLEGGVEGAYFASSSNGWIKTELFYGWIKKKPFPFMLDVRNQFCYLSMGTLLV